MANPINYVPDPIPEHGKNYTMVVQGGGSSSSASGVLSDGLVDPVAAPSDTTVTNRYTNTVTGTEWVWPANGLAWQQVV